MNETEIPTSRTDATIWREGGTGFEESTQSTLDLCRKLERENATMREAIQEAWTEIQYAEASFAGMALRLHPSDPDNDAVLARIGKALAKLQPFIN